MSEILVATASRLPPTFDGNPLSWDLLTLPPPVYAAIYLVIIAILSAWAHQQLWRISDRVTASHFRALAYVLMSLIVLRLFRMVEPDPVISRYLWYMFYVPQMTCGTLGVIIANQVLKTHWRRAINAFAICVSIAMEALILTNDLHHWVFVFPTSALSEESYTMESGFSLVIAWMAILGTYYVAMLLFAGVWVRNWFFLGATVATIFFLVFYHAALFVGQAPGTEEVLVDVVCIWLIAEFLIRSGAVRHNRRLLRMFAITTVPAYIFDNDWVLQKRTSQATKIPPTVLEAIKKGSEHVAPEDPHNPTHATDYIYFRIDGGHFVWERDYSILIHLRNEHQRICDRLDRMLQLSTSEINYRSEQGQLSYRIDVLTEIENIIKERLAIVEHWRNELPKASSERRMELLRRIGMYLGHCKHVGLLVLDGHFANQGALAARASADRETSATRRPRPYIVRNTLAVMPLTQTQRATVERKALATYLQQACVDFSTPNSQAGIFMSTQGSIDLGYALQVLHGCQALLEFAAEGHLPSLFIRITPSRLSVMTDDPGDAQTIVDNPRFNTVFFRDNVTVDGPSVVIAYE